MSAVTAGTTADTTEIARKATTPIRIRRGPLSGQNRIEITKTETILQIALKKSLLSSQATKLNVKTQKCVRFGLEIYLRSLQKIKSTLTFSSAVKLKK